MVNTWKVLLLSQQTHFVKLLCLKFYASSQDPDALGGINGQSVN